MILHIVGSERMKEAREDAAKAVGRRRTYGHDDVVAQFSLGTWRWMLPSANNVSKRQLWDDATVSAFPRLFDVSVPTLIEWISIVYDFRNRVAHFEPIFQLDLRGKRQAIRNVLNTINVDVRKWFLENDGFGAAIDAFYADWPQLSRSYQSGQSPSRR